MLTQGGSSLFDTKNQNCNNIVDLYMRHAGGNTL